MSRTSLILLCLCPVLQPCDARHPATRDNSRVRRFQDPFSAETGKKFQINFTFAFTMYSMHSSSNTVR